MAGARWLRQRSNARKCEFAMKALTVWRAVPPCCHAVLAQSMRAQHASNTTARANYHTHLPSFKRPAITFGQIGLATQTMEPVVRGARGTCLQTGREVALDVSSLGRPHRARPSTRRGNTLSVDGNTLSGITKLPPPPERSQTLSSMYPQCQSVARSEYRSEHTYCIFSQSPSPLFGVHIFA